MHSVSATLSPVANDECLLLPVANKNIGPSRSFVVHSHVEDKISFNYVRACAASRG